MDSPKKIAVKSNDSSGIILFDGVCNLCNGAVQFIIKRDKNNQFRFASLQSPFGQQQLHAGRLDPVTLHSIILLHHNKLLQRSDAILEIAKYLSGLWPALYLFKIVPRFIRDGVYNFISTNRYRFFGKRDACMLPSQELKNKFIETSL